MPNIALVIEYVGTAYHGYQVQAGKQASVVTIQGTIEQALGRLTRESIRIIGAGRTDSGVHALGQVANFTTGSRIPPERFAPAANTMLPHDIRIVRSFEVDEDFNARFDAISKVYRYLVAPAEASEGVAPGAQAGSAQLGGRALLLPEPMLHDAVQRMAEAGRALVGRHDFAAYAAAGSSARTSVRTVHRLEVGTQRWPALELNLLCIEIEADGFLYKMVRTIAAALIEVGMGRQDIDWPRRLLEGRDRSAGPATAAPDGLYLARVAYPEPYGALADPRMCTL